MPTLRFSVDAALLKELGEKLVGKPHIALAELVKNGYDADANKVVIELDPDKDRIEVRDDGHGMDFEEFENFWMRVGSPHKEKQRVSRRFERTMTGSKGVGRLSVQYLAEKFELHTVSDKNPNKILKAKVEWSEAIRAGDLTSAEVEYEIDENTQQLSKGTTIVLSGLKQDWEDKKYVVDLAKEIWWLQPPFRTPAALKPADASKRFEIEFVSPKKALANKFDSQIRAVMDIWCAKLVGKNTNGKVDLSLEYAGEEPKFYDYLIPDCELKGGDFEIRIFKLQRRQPRGIKVQEAREYFEEHGGVHVYDEGFHLPYYGNKRNDWLNIQHDQAQRSRTTKLLPKELRFGGGSISFLPTLSRIFGVVNVDTSKEEDLKILITRDRLQDTPAFRNLIFMIRWAMDLYANEEARRVNEYRIRTTEIDSPKEKFEKVEQAIQKHKADIPEPVYEDLLEGVRKATEVAESEAEIRVKQTRMLGPLATAGISSLAYQHELKKQFSLIDGIVEQIDKIATNDEKTLEKISHLKEDLKSWVERARKTNDLFAYLSNSENMEQRERFRAKKVIQDIKNQVNILARGIPIETSRVDAELLLPKATLAEWGSIFQNVFINAFNAMLDSEQKKLDVSSRLEDGYREILVQDKGAGIDLAAAAVFFEPFARKSKISPERRSMGYGGTGLGLTIVKLVAQNVGCEASFVEPEKGFSTAFCIKWRE